ncbi:nucleoside 2-deoxyribosyltransferase [Streptomyces sp. NPDC050095]|uniref:nucleoside 2-deoxyribosyltransferase n=1 Tax=unclassified Streptomyces TaxID=2593676 RepID=UPI00342B667D
MYYVAHRLFAAHDRLLAARLADRIAVKTGQQNVFLPFCDTDEEDLVAEVKGRRLYELDSERLRALTGMVAILHGPSLDDGVCMEIGYAYALGVPVTVVTTDFQTYSLGAEKARFDFPDPLVEAAATSVIRVARLAPPTPGSVAGTRFTAFADRNEHQLDWALDAAVEELLGHPGPSMQAPPDPAPQARTAFVEPSPYSPDPDALLAAAVESGFTVHTTTRFTATDPHVAAAQDLAHARSASHLVADVSGPETPPGAAVLIGAAAARGTAVAAYQPRATFTHAAGREPNWRNLMIQYAATAHPDTPDALAAWLRSW